MKQNMKIIQFAKEQEDRLDDYWSGGPLLEGLADRFRSSGTWPYFGPSKAAAKLKAASHLRRKLMKKYEIPTAEYAVFTNL